jgi:hypothetical protein
VLRLEVLVLDQGPGPAEMDGGHELVDQLNILVAYKKSARFNLFSVL